MYKRISTNASLLSSSIAQVEMSSTAIATLETHKFESVRPTKCSHHIKSIRLW